jgi:8-oxo-dGTP diphosphatase
MSPAPYKKLLANNMRSARADAGLSQDDVAERMRALGFTSWQRSTASLIESADRRVTAEELAALALVFDTTIQQLVTPADKRDSQHAEMPSGIPIHRRRFMFDDGSVEWRGNDPVFPVASGRQEQIRAGVTELADWVREARNSGTDIELEVAPGELAQPVVAAIVTSAKGVLVGRRNDGSPPWTFIAGEQEPGELPEDTIVREVKEETGLEVRAGQLIGERDHPATRRHMLYLAARPAGRSTKVAVGDEAELAEVRWISLAEADELLPGMFGPVHDYLGGLGI